MTKGTLTGWKENLVYNIPFLISACAFLALNMVTDRGAEGAAYLLVWIVLLAGRKKFRPEGGWKGALSAVLAAAVALSFGIAFYGSLVDRGFVVAAAGKLGLSSGLLMGSLAAVGAMTAVYFLHFPIGAMLSRVSLAPVKTEPVQKPDRKVLLREGAVCLAAAAAAITFLSKSSPLYPLNDWVDSQCFFTVGKSMLHGLLPYRDLAEQKGPLLYMLHTLAAKISYTTFFGVYLLEILFAAVFLWISRKIQLLYRKDASLLWIPVMAAIVYSAPAFLYGDSAEELCLPMMACCLCFGLRSIRTGKDISFREAVLIGITSACVLWIKFSLLGGYIGWFAAYGALKLRDGKPWQAVKTALAIGLGVMVTTVPVLLFFALQGALPDLWTGYFYNNLFLYSTGQANVESSGLLVNLCAGFRDMVRNNVRMILLLAAALVWSQKPGRGRDSLLLRLTAAGMFTVIYVGGRQYDYYSLLMCCFVPVGLLAVQEWAEKNITLPRRSRTAAVLLACFVGAYVTSESTYLLLEPRENLPQYQFAQIIQQEEDPTLLNYGFLDGGFYTVLGIVPNCRYFCRLNVPIEEMYQEQDRFLEEGLVDFVVTRNRDLNFEKYRLVAEWTYFVEYQNLTYSLYQLQ